jgi:para-nitrobenzyl esterase
MKTLFLSLHFALLLFSVTMAQNSQIKTANGTIEGTYNPETNIASYKGIPYAQPPIGNLRWREPQPAKSWSAILKADHFSHMPMQKHIYDDMIFRADTMSEDCLYLNVWTPAKTAREKLPVLVYFYGGGFVSGDGSESRYDGESMAQKGIVTLTISYRVGIFGFFCHPELTQESPHHASGNYALLDQNAALKWVQENITAFGGDPARVTIAGESAGSFSVSAQMVSPLSKNLIAGAVGESGAVIKLTSLADAEKNGAAFGEKIGAKSLADLRAMPASQLLDSAKRWRQATVVDGYFIVKQPFETLEAGEQAHVPLLVGWNSAEVPYQVVMGRDTPTAENYAKKLKQLYPDKADEVLKLYPADTQDELIKSATELASDRFIAYSTWKWADLQAKTGYKPVYRYLFSCPRPPMVTPIPNTSNNSVIPQLVGAAHASEIEFAMGNLSSNKVYAWTPGDYKVSATMETYFANFIKTGNPNGQGLPKWEPNIKGSAVKFININADTKLETDNNRERYLFLDKEYFK